MMQPSCEQPRHAPVLIEPLTPARLLLNPCPEIRARGWARLGAAHLCLGHARAAASAYRQGLSLDASSREMRLGLQLAQAAVAAQGDRRKAMRH